MEKEYGYNELDSMLVLKDILARVWKNRGKEFREIDDENAGQAADE